MIRVGRGASRSAQNVTQVSLIARVLVTLTLSLFVGTLLTIAAPTAGIAGEGSAVPNFKVKNLQGKNVELSELLEQGPVLIDFWATWCKPCKRELPYIEELFEEYGDQGLSVLTVSIDQTRSLSKVKSYIKTHKYEFEVLLDPNSRLLKKMKGSTVPYLLIVSPEGERLFVHSGYRDGDEKELAEQVESIMAKYGKAASDDETSGADASGDAEGT